MKQEIPYSSYMGSANSVGAVTSTLSKVKSYVAIASNSLSKAATKKSVVKSYKSTENLCEKLDDCVRNLNNISAKIISEAEAYNQKVRRENELLRENLE